MEHDELIEYITKREQDFGLFNIEINGVNIYNYVNRLIQEQLLTHYGSGLNYKNPKVSDKERKRNLRKSFAQLIKLFLFIKKYDTVIRSFERVDFINGNYIDKFTDPLVDYTDIGKSYVILEQGRSGAHYTPRCHSDRVVYTDIIYWLAWKFISIRKVIFYKRHSGEIDLLFSNLNAAFPEILINKDDLFTLIVRSCFITKCYRLIFRRIGAKRLFAPARASFKHVVPAAKMQGLVVYELQHGLTKKSITYAGYQDYMFTPDFFLSFGKIPRAEAYGIAKSKVIEIGWAFMQLIKAVEEKIDNNHVLVVSSPDISTKMISVVCKLAKQNPDVIFHFRPHPLEVLNPDKLTTLSQTKNIIINNNLENITVTLMRFNNVIGVNSTVLYEALAMGKKVGKLKMEGFEIRFLSEDGKNHFYIITDNTDFKFFINSPKDTYPFFEMYTEFKPEIVNNLLL